MKNNDSPSTRATAHWADETAAKIIKEKGEKDLYTCASGITPSGTVHVGNFREIISVDLVVRALKDLGKNVRFIYSWDDYDVLRKVPKNMPEQEMLEAHLRFPITMVPDPWGRDKSYARHHEVDIETVLPQVGIHPEFLYQADRYRACQYADGIRKALEHRDALKAILDKFRDEEHKIQGEWWPISVFCSECNRDTTEIDSWDGDWGVAWHCDSCGHKETSDVRKTPGFKLIWRVDWPMRWSYEHVDFEPAGKDHHSQGGSFDTSRYVCKEAYDYDAPITFRYDFIRTKGLPGKMSSSKGNVITIADVLSVYTPEVTRYIFAGTRPNTEFAISFDLDVIKIYEDYDKTERIALGDEEAKNEATLKWEKRIYELSQVNPIDLTRGHGGTERKLFQVPFRHMCNLVQIHDGDVEKAVKEILKDIDEKNCYLLPVNCYLSRAERAMYWIDNCAPDEFKFKLRPEGEKAETLTADEHAAVSALRDKVVAHIEDYADDKACAQAIYDVATGCGMEGKALFRAAYHALIGKDQGPRLANFLRTISKERLMGILSKY
jgi:lysyl-tRNA synthetase class 1